MRVFHPRIYYSMYICINEINCGDGETAVVGACNSNGSKKSASWIFVRHGFCATSNSRFDIITINLVDTFVSMVYYCVSRCCIVWMAFIEHNNNSHSLNASVLLRFLLLPLPLLLFGGKSCSNGFLDKMLDDELFDRIICVAELTFSLFHSIEETLWMYLI